MDLILDLLQGAGLGAAIGIRPFLPALLAGALATGDLGLDYDGTEFAFLERASFLLALVAAVAALDFAQRRREEGWSEIGLPGALLAGTALVLGALEAAGSLADRDHPIWPGLVAGAAAAALALAAARSLFARTRARLDPETRGALPLYAEGLALAAAGAAIAFPPLAVPVLAGLAWLAWAGRRRDTAKYAGLRILR